jgi:hypothetical protein
MICRGLRLELVSGLAIALLVPALPLTTASAQGVATTTTLNVETRDQGGRTKATVAVKVMGEDGLPATGAVSISDHGKQLAGAVLNADGLANTVLALGAGNHTLRAVYIGDANHRVSGSATAAVHALATTTPDFQVSASPATVSLTAGQSGTSTASVTPENSAALTSPMFVTLSCSGLPDQSSCTFTPENVEVLPNATVPLTSSIVIQTQAANRTPTARVDHPSSNSVAWAILLPGALGLCGLAWGVRRRPWLNRLTLLALVGLVTLLGTTACNPRYNYYNHGPPFNPATPAGTYTMVLTAQSSNGVTAITHSTSMVLTVK